MECWAPGGLQCSCHGSASIFSARLCSDVWGNSGAVPQGSPLTTNANRADLWTSRDDSAFPRVCGFNSESTLF